MSLAQQLAALPTDLRENLRRFWFNEAQLEELAATIGQDPDLRNRLKSGVQPPLDSDIDDYPAEGTAPYKRFFDLGMSAICRGELAFIVLAGGMATRMGGVVKALVPVVEDRTFLQLRLGENSYWSAKAGKPLPLWLMTSWATNEKLNDALAAANKPGHVATFVQNVSVRLTAEGNLFTDDHGQPSLYATGHGDLPEALQRSGLVDRFLANGGKYVWIANIDNLGATVDPANLGWHIEHGAPVSVEVANKEGTDRGGIPVRIGSRSAILEEFRLPRDFDASQVRAFNCNTFLANAAALASLHMPFTWLQVKKNVGGRAAIQFERLIGEITTVLGTRMLRVPRDGVRSRFLPVKDNDELQSRRDVIAQIARARGML